MRIPYILERNENFSPRKSMLYGVFHHIDYIDLRPFRQRIIEEFAYLIVKIVSTFGEITEKYILRTRISIFNAFKQIKMP